MTTFVVGTTVLGFSAGAAFGIVILGLGFIAQLGVTSLDAIESPIRLGFISGLALVMLGGEYALYGVGYGIVGGIIGGVAGGLAGTAIVGMFK